LKEHGKWIITKDHSEDGELICISENTWTNYNDLYDLDNLHMRSIAIDIDNSIWIVTRFNGIVHIDGENVTIYNDYDLGITVNYYFCINIDSNGIKWIGTSSGLVNS
jgi:ligand-binding sensor domain-containing protein